MRIEPILSEILTIKAKIKSFFLSTNETKFHFNYRNVEIKRKKLQKKLIKRLKSIYIFSLK